MRKSYGLSLEIEATEKVRAWLATRGLSFSGWVNALIVEVARELENEECSWMRKPLDELTLAEFLEGAAKWIHQVKKEEEIAKCEK